MKEMNIMKNELMNEQTEIYSKQLSPELNK